MHDVADGPRVCHQGGCHTEPQEARGPVWRRMGRDHHHPQGAGHVQRPELPLPDDLSVLHQRAS